MQFRIRFSLATAFVFSCSLIASAPVLAGPAEKFAELHQKYLAADKQISELTKLYQEQEPGLRDTVLKAYLKEVEKANGILVDLRAAGIEAYKADPNKDEKLTNVLLGIVANDIRHDHYESAAELAQLMLENKCDKKVLSDLAGRAAYALDDFDKAETLLGEAKSAKALTPEGKRVMEDLKDAKERWVVEQDLRQKEAQADDLPRVKIETNKGTVVIELYENEAPQTVGNFVSLVEKGFYNGTPFHRVLSGFMAQGGDPKGEGTGGPGYQILCECGEPNHRNHFRGTLSMAHAGKDTGGSQFFLTFLRTPHLDGKHTVFGRVVEGLEVLPKLQRRVPSRSNLPEPDKIVKATVVRKREHTYEPTKTPDKKGLGLDKEKTSKEKGTESKKDASEKEKKGAEKSDKESGGEADKEKGEPKNDEADKDKPKE